VYCCARDVVLSLWTWFGLDGRCSCGRRSSRLEDYWNYIGRPLEFLRERLGFFPMSIKAKNPVLCTRQFGKSTTLAAVAVHRACSQGRCAGRGRIRRFTGVGRQPGRVDAPEITVRRWRGAELTARSDRPRAGSISGPYFGCRSQPCCTTVSCGR